VLKKTIYQLEKRQHGLDYDLESNERVSLLQDSDRSDTDSIFIPLLDKELNKIIVFYDPQERELLNDIAQLEEEVKQTEEAGLTGRGHYYDDEIEEDDDDDDDDETNEGHSRSPKRKRRKSTSLALSRQRSTGSVPLFHSIAFRPIDARCRQLGRRRTVPDFPDSPSLQPILERRSRRPRREHHISPSAKVA
jgi:hypothetical protein